MLKYKISRNIEVESNMWTGRAAQVLTEHALDIVADLHVDFEGWRQELLQLRVDRQKRFDEGFLPSHNLTHISRTSNWKVAEIPADLQKRRVEITGPASSRKMVINMLNPNNDGSRADAAMLDLEDSMCPTWRNVIDGYLNIAGVANGRLRFKDPKSGKVYSLDANRMAHPMFRIRGLHLNESGVLVNGEPVSAGLLDLVVVACSTVDALVSRGKTPMIYIPKCEHFLEARFWNHLFRAVERALGLKRGTIKTTFLIETLTAAYQVEEILYETRERTTALNCGRWDKIFSDIKVLGKNKGYVFGDRSSIDMKQVWMDNYAKFIIKICHRHGALALGGMSAFTPGSDPEARKRQLGQVTRDKAYEASIGHDGCWVSHPFFIGPAMQQFPFENQLDKQLLAFSNAPNLLPIGGGKVTMQGLRKNIRVGLAYIKAWIDGVGCIALDGQMEDLATLEISRAQVWQWLYHGVKTECGKTICESLVEELFLQEMNNLILSSSKTSGLEKAKWHNAMYVATSIFNEEKLSQFFVLQSKYQQPKRRVRI